jgi:hypothetical protein
MQAITVRDRDAGVAGLSLTDMPYPHASQNDVIVPVHAAGFTPHRPRGQSRGSQPRRGRVLARRRAVRFTRLTDGELLLNIQPRCDGAAVLVSAHSLAGALAQAKAILESY